MRRGMMELLIQKEIFAYVDFYFAKSLVQSEEESPALFLLSYMLCMARGGHLCIEIKNEKVYPHPSLLTSDATLSSFLEEKIVEAFQQLNSSLCQRVIDVEIIPTTPLCLFQDNLYLQKNWLLEKEFFSHIKRIQGSSLILKGEDPLISTSLNEEQSEAVRKALVSPISVISGGPGTGKTFTAVEILRSFLQSLSEEDRAIVKVKLAAPTGKAAALLEKNVRERLGYLKGVECGTLHSFLKIGFHETHRGAFRKSLFADLFLVDEASMLDAKLFCRLLSSLQEGGRLILMGDKDQLPPVEAGGFFADLIDLAQEFVLPATVLQKSLRVEKKALQYLAEAILSGDFNLVRKQEGANISTSLNIQKVRELVWKECQFFFSLPLSSTFSPIESLRAMEKFRILSCIRKGPLGVESLNEMVLKYFLEPLHANDYLVCPILITANDSPRSLMNGDMGLLVAKSSSLKRGFYGEGDRVYFFSKEKEEEVRELPAVVLPSFEFGYCLSVHKSQGSEYEAVLILAPPGSEKFGKEVLYTAVTRAKKNGVLIGEEGTLRILLDKGSRKISGLRGRLGVGKIV